MNTHEYQAKNLLLKYGIPVPPFILASTEEEVVEGIKELGLFHGGVVKVQIHAGGRGKAGGVKIASNGDELQQLSCQLLGTRIINEQTGPSGVICYKVLLSPQILIDKEYYLAVIIDRELGKPIVIASPEGGMEIEEIAKQKPEKILKLPIQRQGIIRRYHLLELCHFMQWTGDLAEEGSVIVQRLAEAFLDSDASLLEINPLVLTKEGKLCALDAKLSLDDNALYRHPEAMQWDDTTQITEGERLAKQQHLAYIGLDGDIGCLVNGAGLAMATMDIIAHYGGKPANFLDVGGGATQDQVCHAFQIILSDPRVKKIFVNIFGGIMDCAVLAKGIVAAVQEKELHIPLIVRMEGTNVQEGKQILQASHLTITAVDSMDEGARACQS